MGAESKAGLRIREAITALRRVRDRCVLTANRALNREYIPSITEAIYIEPTSICNLSCRFCGYCKKQSPKCVMPYERFCNYIDQATELGYTRFNLTPLTGEVFADRGLFEKLAYLDQHPKVLAYRFFSNFTLANPQTVAQLFTLKKLQKLTISLYGHDRDSFLAITEADGKVYRRLVENLRELETHIPSRRFTLGIGWRTVQGGHRRKGSPGSELLSFIERLRDVHNIRAHISRDYNNWGGLILPEDLEGLDIYVKPPEATYKNGACALIFSRMIITADGRMNACACRDVDVTLCIGDLKEQSLREILSTQNERYMKLIEDQQQGRFGRVCHDCDMYKSIYRYRSAYRSHRERPMGLEQFYAELRKRTASPTEGARTGPEDHEVSPVRSHG